MTCALFIRRVFLCSRRRRYEAACTLEDDMSAVYRMLSSLAAYDAGATVTAPEYE
jgi:hypothetical protein